MVIVKLLWQYLGSAGKYGSFTLRSFGINSSEKFTNCCHGGSVILSPLSKTHDLIKDLLCKNSLEAKNYKEHIQQYNAAFSFASMGAETRNCLLEQIHIASEYTVRYMTGFLLCTQMITRILAMDSYTYLTPFKLLIIE